MCVCVKYVVCVRCVCVGCVCVYRGKGVCVCSESGGGRIDKAKELFYYDY